MGRIVNAILRDIDYNIRGDRTMPLGKAKRLLDGLEDADQAIQFRQRVREAEAAKANHHTTDNDLASENEQLKALVSQLRKDLDAARKQIAASKHPGKAPGKAPKADTSSSATQ